VIVVRADAPTSRSISPSAAFNQLRRAPRRGRPTARESAACGAWPAHTISFSGRATDAQVQQLVSSARAMVVEPRIEEFGDRRGREPGGPVRPGHRPAWRAGFSRPCSRATRAAFWSGGAEQTAAAGRGLRRRRREHRGVRSRSAARSGRGQFHRALSLPRSRRPRRRGRRRPATSAGGRLPHEWSGRAGQATHRCGGGPLVVAITGTD